MMDPSPAGIDAHQRDLQSRTFSLLKLHIAVVFCKRIATRLVPFATEAGKPKKIRSGRVRKEPPPAITLIVPAIVPAMSNRKYACQSSKERILPG